MINYHTDQILRKHHLLLEVNHLSNGYRLIDWISGEPVTREQVRAYVAEARGGFPGPAILDNLASETQVGAER
jgi:hypothetical protein